MIRETIKRGAGAILGMIIRPKPVQFRRMEGIISAKGILKDEHGNIIEEFDVVKDKK